MHIIHVHKDVFGLYSYNIISRHYLFSDTVFISVYVNYTLTLV